MKKYLFVLALILFGYVVGQESALACNPTAVSSYTVSAPVVTQQVVTQQVPVYTRQVVTQAVAVEPYYAVGVGSGYGVEFGVGIREPRRFFPRPVGRLPGRGGVAVHVGF